MLLHSSRARHLKKVNQRVRGECPRRINLALPLHFLFVVPGEEMIRWLFREIGNPFIFVLIKPKFYGPK